MFLQLPHGLLCLPGMDEKLTLPFDMRSTGFKKMVVGELGSGKVWKQRGPSECEELMNQITGDILKKDMKRLGHILDISFIRNESKMTLGFQFSQWGLWRCQCQRQENWKVEPE